MQRKGRKKKPFYHIVIADARSPRDGRFIEKIGTYNPLTKPATIEVDRDKAFDWVMKGAQPTDTVRAILRFKGIYYRKHLVRGVQKGAMSQEEADLKYDEWVNGKESKVAARVAKQAEELANFHAQVAGTHITVAPPAPVVVEVEERSPLQDEEVVAPAIEAEVETPAMEATTEVAEEAIAEETTEVATEVSGEEQA